MKNHKGAAFIASTMLMCQHEPLDMLMYYDARRGGMNGMFSSDVVSDLLPGYYPFYMFNKLYEEGTEVATESNGGDDIVAVGAVGNGGCVMLSHFNDDDTTEEKTVKVSFTGVENENGVRLEYYLSDKDHACELVREEIFTAESFAAYIKMPLYSQYLLKIVKL